MAVVSMHTCNHSLSFRVGSTRACYTDVLKRILGSTRNEVRVLSLTVCQGDLSLHEDVLYEL